MLRPDAKAAIVKLLLATPECRLDIRDRFGATPLHRACFHNSSAVIPLYCQDPRCTPELINHRDNYGDTAMMQAVCRGRLGCVKELAKVPGLDWSARNHGKDLIKMARDEGHPEVVAFLDERELKPPGEIEMAAETGEQSWRWRKESKETREMESPAKKPKLEAEEKDPPNLEVKIKTPFTEDDNLCNLVQCDSKINK